MCAVWQVYFYYAGYNLHLHGNEAFQRDSAGKMKDDFLPSAPLPAPCDQWYWSEKGKAYKKKNKKKHQLQ